MEPMPCIDTALRLSAAEQRRLLDIARASIANGLQHQRPLLPDHGALDGALAEARACFVSLHLDGLLRGCIGSLVARDPLGIAAAEYAFRAAFADPRFPPLPAALFPALALEISVLSEPEPLPGRSRDELLASLRPGSDGLILCDGPAQATFLPKVWQQLPDPEDFLAALLMKAGLPPDHWSPTIRCARYVAVSFGDADAPPTDSAGGRR